MPMDDGTMLTVRKRNFPDFGVTGRRRSSSPLPISPVTIYREWYRYAGTLVRFEFKPKTERVNMRLSKDLLESVKKRAAKAGVSYQRFIRLALERAVSEA
jgi:hypothetical protein